MIIGRLTTLTFGFKVLSTLSFALFRPSRSRYGAYLSQFSCLLCGFNRKGDAVLKAGHFYSDLREQKYNTNTLSMAMACA
ncbi:MAG: hypothetical protein ACI93R_002990 [Flavobacteriales bacterium]|jgi:hypothetical protein